MVSGELKTMNRNFIKYLTPIFVIVLLQSCVLKPEEYDSSDDDGTYRGEMTAYDGPGTDADFVDRTCPTVNATLTVDGDNVSLRTVDTYPNFGIGSNVILNHTATGTSYDNNKFQLEESWAFDETDTQLEDLMNLEVCESSPPDVPGNTNTGDRGLLNSLGFIVGEPGFIGEYGQGTARGSLWYGVKCTDGRFLPLCLYFMQLRKN